MNRYPWPSIALHWLIAFLIFAGFALGSYMHELTLSPQKLRFYSYHKWIGVTVFALVVLRLILRHRLPHPKLLPGPTWQLYLARRIHAMLYLLMFAIPLSGWLMSSAKGFTTVWFGILPLPDIIGKNEDVGELLRDTHALLNWVLATLVMLHAGAALKHHLVDKDITLLRMLPWRKT